MLTRSPRAEEAFLMALAEDVRAPSFGGSGREKVQQGLQMLASRFGSDFRLVLAELDAKSVLKLMVQSDDGHWEGAGYFEMGLARNGVITYFDYREEQLEAA
jgi:hypothetical protein